MRPFLEALADLLGEERIDHYTAQLTDLCQEISAHRKKGDLTLTVSLTPNGDTTFKVSAKLKTNTPNPSFGERIVYHTSEGSILRENPNQRKLPFAVDAATPDSATETDTETQQTA